MTAEVANAGLVRPPLVYAGCIGLGLLLHALWPMRWLPAAVGVAFGVVAATAATALFASAVRAFGKARTPVPGNRPTSAIVRDGPYGFSRNPIYLAFTLLHLALAAGLNSLGMLLALLPALGLMGWVVIPREERYLEARFPSEYPRYRREVRRWL
jgi:protein-S-isoprenylcysteine O-methyltransferase Ste14